MKKFGLNTGDTNVRRIKRVIKIKQGGITKTMAYHLNGAFHSPICENKFLMPVFFSASWVKAKLAATGPISINGNMRIPSILGIACPLNSFDETKIKAPSHDMAKVPIK